MEVWPEIDMAVLLCLGSSASFLAPLRVHCRPSGLTACSRAFTMQTDDVPIEQDLAALLAKIR